MVQLEKLKNHRTENDMRNAMFHTMPSCRNASLVGTFIYLDMGQADFFLNGHGTGMR